MGAQVSKTAGNGETAAEKPGEAAASPSKANGQENGHVKVNGDASPAAAEEKEVQANGSADGEKPEDPAEKEPAEGEEKNTEVSAPVEEEPAKPADAATPSASNETPKKKKRFSFKKSFKLSGFSFRKTKKEKETGDGAEDAVEEDKTEVAEAVEGGVLEENAKPAEEPAGETKPVEEKPAEQPNAACPATEEPKEEEKPAESVPDPTASPTEAPAPTGQEAGSSPEDRPELATE